MLKAFRKSAGSRQIAEALHAAIAGRAREPVFYTGFQVPDTVDGRFDLIALHAWLMLDRMRAPGLRDLSQHLIDILFRGFDEGLRELGAGDMGMSRKMKKMASAFYGRLSAYDAATAEGAMKDALLRNLYRGEASQLHHAEALAAYVESARAHLAAASAGEGGADFGPLPRIRQ